MFKVMLAPLIYLLLFINLYANQELPDQMPLDEVFFLGAHNAPMSKSYHWIYRQQNLSIEKLWDYGVRWIKVPLHYFRDKTPSPLKKKPYFAMCHEFTSKSNCTLTLLSRPGRRPPKAKKYFQKIYKLLMKHPQEIFILKLESFLPENNPALAKKFDKLLEETGLSQLSFKLTSPKALPTLGEIRKSQKRLLIFIHYGDKNINASPYLNVFSTYYRQSHWMDKFWKRCQMTPHSKDQPFFEMNVNPEVSLEKASLDGKALKLAFSIGKKMRVNHSTLLKVRDYSFINSKSYAKKRLAICRKYQKDRLFPQVITSDFVERGDLNQLVSFLNKKRAYKYRSPSLSDNAPVKAEAPE